LGTAPTDTGAKAAAGGIDGGMARCEAPAAVFDEDGGGGGTGAACGDDGGAGGTDGAPTAGLHAAEGVGGAAGIAGGGRLSPGGGKDEGRASAAGANSDAENEGSATARKELVEGARIGVNAGTESRRPRAAGAGGITLPDRVGGDVGSGAT
jgi:hypothetical protein